MATKAKDKEIVVKVTSKGLVEVNKALAQMTTAIGTQNSGLRQRVQGLADAFTKLESMNLNSTAKRLNDLQTAFGKGSGGLVAQMRKFSDNTFEAANSLSLYNNELRETIKMASSPALKSLDNIGSASSGEMLAELKLVTHLLDEINDQTRENAMGYGQMVEGIEDLNTQTNIARRNTRELGDEIAKANKKANAPATPGGKGGGDLGRNSKNTKRSMSDLLFLANPFTAAFAAVAATVYTVGESFRILDDILAQSRFEKSITQLGAVAGQGSLTLLASQLQDISDASLSANEALRLASKTATYGFSTDQMKEMTEGAKKASIALGINFADALERITKGIAKQEVELLDELGIVTRLEPALKKFAARNGKTVDQLTDLERQTALANEALSQMKDKYGEINIEATGTERLAAALKTLFRDLATAIADSGLNTLFLGMAKLLEKAPMEKQARLTAQVAEDLNKTNKESVLSTVGAIVSGKAAIKQTTELMAEQKDLVDRVEAVNSRFGRPDILKQHDDLRASYTQVVTAVSANITALRNLGIRVDLTDEQFEVLHGTLQGIGKAMVNASDNLGSLSTATNMLDHSGRAAAEQLASMAKEIDLVASFDATGKSTGELLAKFSELTSISFKSTEQIKLLANALNNLPRALTAIDLDKQIADLGFASGGYKEQDTGSKLASERVALEAQIAEYTRVNIQSNGQLHGETLKQLEDQKKLLEYKEKQYKAEQHILAVTRDLEYTAAFKGVVLDETGEGNITNVITQYTDLEAAIYEADKAHAHLKAVEATASAETDAALRHELYLLGIKTSILDNIAKKASTSNAMAALGVEDRSSMSAGTKAEAQAESGLASYQAAFDNLSGFDDVAGNMVANLQKVGTAFTYSGEAALSMTEKAQMGMDAVAGVLAFTSSQNIASIDAQIEAEKKRDGKSEESLAKIKALEKKRIKEKEKADIASIGMSTASGIMNAFSTMPYPAAIVASAGIAALGMIQLQNVRKAAAGQIAGLDAGSADPSKIQIGERDFSVDLGNAANAGELQYLQGAQGVGTGMGNFTPRSAGGDIGVGAGVSVGENGPEVFIPSVPGYIANNSSSGAGSSSSTSIVLKVDALDSQSIIDRAGDIFKSLEYELNARGKSLSSL